MRCHAVNLCAVTFIWWRKNKYSEREHEWKKKQHKQKANNNNHSENFSFHTWIYCCDIIEITQIWYSVFSLLSQMVGFGSNYITSLSFITYFLIFNLGCHHFLSKTRKKCKQISLPLRLSREMLLYWGVWSGEKLFLAAESG